MLYCSVHEEDSFPKTGWVDEIGTGAGRGYTLNAPLAAGSTIADYLLVFSEVFIPALTRFQPDALIVSAGQDALFDDRRGRMNLEPEDFGVLTGMLIDSTDLPLALTLEGATARRTGRRSGRYLPPCGASGLSPPMNAPRPGARKGLWRS